MKKVLAVLLSLVVVFAPTIALAQPSSAYFRDANGNLVLRTGTEAGSSTGQPVDLGTTDRWTTPVTLRSNQPLTSRSFTSPVIDVSNMPGQKFLVIKIPGNNVVNAYWGVDCLTTSTSDSTNTFYARVGGYNPFGTGANGSSVGRFGLIQSGAALGDSVNQAAAIRSWVIPLSMWGTGTSGVSDSTSAKIPIDFPYLKIHLWSDAVINFAYAYIVGRKQ